MVISIHILLLKSLLHRIWLKVNVKGCPIGYSSRREIAEGNRPEPWFVVGWPVPFYRLGRYHNLGHYEMRRMPTTTLLILRFCFLKSLFCCFTTQQSGRDHPNHPPYTVGRSNRLLLLGHRNTPLAKHQRPIGSNPGIELGPPRWKAAR